ncbi:MAG: hypothetical protein CMJ78_19490 [Planctomycetaceae bacterium]|nr:hypothetical protein [Planctomycetaceae bacterium]
MYYGRAWSKDAMAVLELHVETRLPFRNDRLKLVCCLLASSLFVLIFESFRLRHVPDSSPES